MEPTVQESVQQFLSSRRIALVGFSRNPKDFSRVLDTQLRDLCPMMALPGASWPHRLHGWFRRGGR